MRTRHRVLVLRLSLLTFVLLAHPLCGCGSSWSEDVEDMRSFLAACPSAAPPAPYESPVVPLAATEPGDGMAPHLYLSGAYWALDEDAVQGATHAERLGALEASLEEFDARWALLHPSAPRTPVTLGVQWRYAAMAEVLDVLERLAGRRVDLLVDTDVHVRRAASISGAPPWAVRTGAAVVHAAPGERLPRLRPDIARAAWGCPALMDELVARGAGPLHRLGDWVRHDAAQTVDRCGPGTSDPRALAELLAALLPLRESRVLPLELAAEGEGALEIAVAPDATFAELVHGLAAAPLRSERVRVRRGGD